MTYVPGSTFGFGTPGTLSSYGGQGFGPFSTQSSIIPAQQLPQIAQLLQIVPQQLQQLQAVQQQQTLQLQLLLQILPAQLQQLQQLIQVIPQQIQQVQQGQPFGSVISGPLGFGLAPHVFGGQTAGHVM